MVMALNSSSASLSWAPTPYNCSLNNYLLRVADEENVSIVSLGSAESTTTNVTTLNMGKTYTFRVASVDAADRMSNWSQPVSLAMQGLLLFCKHNFYQIISLCCHGHAVPAPVEIVSATISESSQLNYNITAEWKV